ncbi:carbohydrate kinase [Ruegeria sp. 2205SS24-7]|uniref:carbohydrate kinase family protein n=1 Tax=Ruegeria discodermiae TaxID=3064389 RepID=UPI0027416043|nr:carbohydrate kinase [Ruegeria sp. 2205SS24-7]MDP5215908.1 carbohydrate kinase [Ruegeria sp. 2205SS24-7]
MILCCGEALIDMLPARTTAGADAFAPHCGGAVFNTSIALGRLEIETGLLTGLSQDFWGEMLRDALNQSNVDPEFSVVSNRPTTLAFVQLKDGQASYSFHDENSAGRGITPQELPDIPDRVQTLFFGGISLCNPPFCDSLVALAEREAGRRTIMVDPNIRPGFVSDAVAYRDRLTRLIAAADLIKVSDEDLAWLRPDLPDDLSRADALLQAGPALVLLTRGSAGATALRTGAEPVSAEARKVTVLDTVGAGDTFNAGFMAKAQELGLLTRQKLQTASKTDLLSCLSFAAQVAAVTVSRAGANPPWAKDLTN